MDPHDPYFEHPYNGHGVARVIDSNPPASHRDELYRLYKGDVAYLDANLGHLFARLKELGLYDDSVVLVTADHGEEFQDHGGWWHGATLYQEAMHVPLLIKRAHESRGGVADPQPARSLDIAPTLMAAAGLAAPASFSGRNLFATPDGDPQALFAEEDFEGNVLASLRVGPWKIITANGDNPRGLAPVELYDLGQDPGEQRNLAAAEPQRTQEMLERLSQFRTQVGRDLRLGTGTITDHVADHRS